MTIDERCYGYEPAASQLGALRQEVATACAEFNAMAMKYSNAVEGSMRYKRQLDDATDALCDLLKETDQHAEGECPHLRNACENARRILKIP